MKVAVVIPVGPGHEIYAESAKKSVADAWAYSRGLFTELTIVVVPDPRGDLGRSAARNKGVRENAADWYFFLDADDKMMPRAFRHVNVNRAATFGAVCLNGKVSRSNIERVTRKMLFKYGAHGTLSMGCFVDGSVARETPFDEALDAGEDFDFYLRLPSFVKVKEPLVSIGYDNPSAGGPRGYRNIQWLEICERVIDRYR